MNRVKTLLDPILANQTYRRTLTDLIAPERLAEISEGGVRITPNEANLIQQGTSGQINADLLLQLNKDDLGTQPKPPREGKPAKTAKSPAFSARGNGPPERGW